jgi:hypothetical protein
LPLEVAVFHKSADDTMRIVKELRQQGLVQGKDFDFAFNQSRWDDMIGEIPKQTIFTFYTEKYATLFALKYS